MMDGLPVDMTEEDVGLHPLSHTSFSRPHLQLFVAQVL